MAGDTLRTRAAAARGIQGRAPLKASRGPPRGLLRNPHMQSIVGVLPPWGPVRRRTTELRARSRSLLLECDEGVRLQALYSRAASGRQLAVLLHGWEGSADSRCVLSLGAALFQAGFDVLRLNLRDHGSTQHLNREIFHCCRLSDVSGALRSIATHFPEGHPLSGGVLTRRQLPVAGSRRSGLTAGGARRSGDLAGAASRTNAGGARAGPGALSTFPGEPLGAIAATQAARLGGST